MRRARLLLHDRQEPAAVHPKTDRRRQLRLCEEAESFARSAECESLAQHLGAAHDAWTDLVPGVDDDLDERFQAAILAGMAVRAGRSARYVRDLLARVYAEPTIKRPGSVVICKRTRNLRLVCVYLEGD